MEAALITGASSGIGMEIAKILASEGNDLVISARSEAPMQRLKSDLEEQFDIHVLIIPMDLSIEENIQSLFNRTQEEDIFIHTLINNAGIGDFGLFHENNWEKTSAMIDLNMKSLTQLTYLYGREMVKERRGKVMNVASTAAFQPGPLMSVYYATKNYVLAFSEGIASEWSDYNITVTALCPGPTKSRFEEEADLEDSKLFDSLSVADAADVAKYGVKSMHRGKRIAIHGLMNKLLIFSIRFMPRSWVTSVVHRMQERKS